MIVGPLQFAAPMWLPLAPALWLAILWISRRSMSGLGRWTRYAAVGARALVVAAIVVALAEPSLRRESQDVAAIVVLDVSRSIPPDQREAARAYIRDASAPGTPSDRLGVVSAATEAYVQSLPSARNRAVGLGHTGRDDATDLSSGVQLAMSVAPEDAATRLVLVSDGNETRGGLLRAAEAARASGVPIDVLPVVYDYQREVVFERLVAPANARAGESALLRFALRSTHSARGRLSLLVNGQPVDLDPASPGLSALIELDPGVNVRAIPVIMPGVGAQRFEAHFEPLDADDDAIEENNVAAAVTFVASAGRVLVYTSSPGAHTALLESLQSAGVEAEVRSPLLGHESLDELASFDAVVLADVSADELTHREQDELRAYVHDIGGGLLVVGGERSYGAGGWIGSPLADALPVRLDPPQKRQLPLGALALVIDRSGSMSGSVGAQSKQQVANEAAALAVGALTRMDIVVVIAFDSHNTIVVPPTPKGDGAAIQQRIRGIGAGGGTYIYGAMQEALRQLRGVNAGVKHVVLLTDGQSQGSRSEGMTIARQMAAEGVSISTVAVGDGADSALLAEIAQRGNGRFYEVVTRADILRLPQIFINEARTVQRSLIWEGPAFTPTRADTSVETMRGLGQVPPISGYIVTADREGLSQVTLRGQEDDPILAQWQYGLGRVVALTTDAASRWSPAWVSWGQLASFWQQHLRWAMRPSGSANVTITTQDEGDGTRVIIDALSAAGDRLNFARFVARVVTPGMGSAELRLRQTGPGRYEGVFDAPAPGAYVVNVVYDAPTGEAGASERGAAQAAVVRMEGLERRALRDNRALLQQVAEMTGGRVLHPEPARAELFSRQGLTPPVSLRPVWLLLAALACALFLVDVAVRRVRLDIPAMAAAARRALGRKRATSQEQIGALRAAREQARIAMATRAGDTSNADAGEPVSGVKFEAAPDAPPAPLTLDDDQRPDHAPSPAPKAAPPAAKEEEAGISRLLKAKQRAHESMRNDEP